MGKEHWYSGGLRFACTQCGNCCTGGPGTVRVSDVEIGALADRFGLSDSEFRSRYTRTLRGGDVSLKEKPDFDCIFFDRTVGCTVYEDRPRQCRTWPFWGSVVFSSEAWDESAEACPGMNSGPLFDGDEITSVSRNDGTSARRKPASRSS
jgi:Fe-S-cluster containining protein